jgi:hypothetical protein
MLILFTKLALVSICLISCVGGRLTVRLPEFIGEYLGKVCKVPNVQELLAQLATITAHLAESTSMTSRRLMSSTNMRPDDLQSILMLLATRHGDGGEDTSIFTNLLALKTMHSVSSDLTSSLPAATQERCRRAFSMLFPVDSAYLDGNYTLLELLFRSSIQWRGYVPFTSGDIASDLLIMVSKARHIGLENCNRQMTRFNRDDFRAVQIVLNTIKFLEPFSRIDRRHHSIVAACAFAVFRHTNAFMATQTDLFMPQRVSWLLDRLGHGPPLWRVPSCLKLNKDYLIMPIPIDTKSITISAIEPRNWPSCLKPQYYINLERAIDDVDKDIELLVTSGDKLDGKPRVMRKVLEDTALAVDYLMLIVDDLTSRNHPLITSNYARLRYARLNMLDIMHTIMEGSIHLD